MNLGRTLGPGCPRWMGLDGAVRGDDRCLAPALTPALSPTIDPSHVPVDERNCGGCGDQGVTPSTNERHPYHQVANHRSRRNGRLLWGIPAAAAAAAAAAAGALLRLPAVALPPKLSPQRSYSCRWCPAASTRLFNRGDDEP